MFVPHASKIWTKSYVQNYTKFWAFWQKKKKKKKKKNGFKKKKKKKNILDKVLTPFWKSFL